MADKGTLVVIPARLAASRLPDKPLKATAEIHIPEIDFRFELNAVIQSS